MWARRPRLILAVAVCWTLAAMLLAWWLPIGVTVGTLLVGCGLFFLWELER